MDDQHMHGDVQAAQADFLHKVWTDDAFAARLEGDPKAVFAEMGSRIDDEVEIRVMRDTDRVKHLHIPAAPSEGEISDGDLARAQGGTFVITGLLAASVTGVMGSAALVSITIAAK